MNLSVPPILLLEDVLFTCLSPHFALIPNLPKIVVAIGFIE